jgi:hypothetical protein
MRVGKDHAATVGPRRLMVDYVERVAEHFGFVRVGGQSDFNRLRELLATDDGDDVLRNVQLAHAREPDFLSAARTGPEFLKRLDELIGRAAEKVWKTKLERERLASLPAEERGGDVEFRTAALRASEERLRSE